MPAPALPGPKELLKRLPRKEPFSARACLVGERLQLRDIPEPSGTLAPLVLPAGESGLAVLLRYGAAVLFHVSDAEQKAFFKELHPRIERPLRRIETEEARVVVADGDGVSAEGIALKELSLPRLQIVATALARSVALAYYEAAMAEAFDVVEPLALRLERESARGRRFKALLRHIGAALVAQHKLTGRIEIGDKPELLWEYPELERLYLRLDGEYELGERATVLERKLALIGHTAEITVELLQNRRMLRVEWYIVLLIVLEVLLYGYEIWWKP
jgi:uncharacterized Rmd1/YagE family protein